MNIQDIADEIRDQWNDERFTPMYFKILMYIGFTSGILGIIINL
jgi:hypothetical protein